MAEWAEKISKASAQHSKPEGKIFQYGTAGVSCAPF